MVQKFNRSFKLLTFQTFDENITGEYSIEYIKYRIQMFGLNEKGQTASIILTDYKPYFYVLVNDNWDDNDKEDFITDIIENLKNNSKKGVEYYNNININSNYVECNKLYGFSGGKLNKFIVLNFDNEEAMKAVKNLWYDIKNKNGEYSKTLKKNGYIFNKFKTRIYEGNIPPLLRLFHIKDISPSGWVSIPNKFISKKRITTCKYEYILNYKSVIPLDKELPVPYKICSFDIEASSSHGDFPLAIKNYDKLSQNIVNVINNKDEDEDIKDYLRRIIKTAFSIEKQIVEDVDIVYPKKMLSEKKIKENIEKWLNLKIKNEDNMNKLIKYNSEISVVELLSKEKDRDILLEQLTITLNKCFPKLKGDIVTFIGSTFMKYGDKKPYKNNCIVINSCSDIPEISNLELECYETEKEILLAWTKLIKKEDPDIIIGYNIFGFDYKFMYERAKELGVLPKFLGLSRNKKEICGKKNWNSNELSIEKSKIVIASGEHELNFIKMNGRLQIDMYNYLRRDYNLTSYKLDNVSSEFIGDSVKKIEHIDDNTKIHSSNLTGLENGNYIILEESEYSQDLYKDGMKFKVFNLNEEEGSFYIEGIERLNMKKNVKWGLAKDDVSPQDIFRMTNEGPDERAIIAKYCIQDCNLVHNLLNKIDVITGYIEMSSLCSVPMDFLVMRGQGIKLTSYISKKCREKNTLMPVLDKSEGDDGYEGAIVLDPKCNLYLNEPVACVDYSSLYPSSMISENISPDSKVWTKEYDLNGNLLKETGNRQNGNYIYDNLPKYKYVNIQYDTFKYRRKHINAAAEKVKVGYKICRFAQFPNNKKGILPSILEECLAARKATRKQIPLQKDQFMKNILDKRQLSIKVTANSIYGQTGARTSTFYEKDVAASTTATGRKLLIYAKHVIEGAYKDKLVNTTNHGVVKTNAEYVYGDTDSVFFKFNLTDQNNNKIEGKKALEITIELAKEAGKLATMFLKNPHDLEYEKTFLPFCLLSKKRYVGMLYENDPNKCKRKSMGIVLKRRDNAPIVKDVYGGIIDILMKEKNIDSAVRFLKNSINDLINGKININKLIISKSLRGNYKNPKQIAHKVLADRIGKRDPGNKPKVGDRIAYVYFKGKKKKVLQSEKIETPQYIIDNKLQIDYQHYITNQIMKPVQQLFALVLEDMSLFRKKRGHTLRSWKREIKTLKNNSVNNEEYLKKIDKLKNNEVKSLLFDEYLIKYNNKVDRNQSLLDIFNILN
jgi:DNA polymerase elongation subunit (family B)